MPWQECRAKTGVAGAPGTTAYDHCRYAGRVAEALAEQLPSSLKRFLPENVGLAVALHDVGKVSPGFQGKYFLPLMEKLAPDWALQFRNNSCGGRNAFNTNHAEVGARALKAYLNDRFGKSPVVAAARAHHGWSESGPVSRPGDQEGGAAWQAERVKLIQALEADFNGKAELPANGGKGEIRADVLSGITCVADWIASDEDFFPPGEQPLSEDALRARVATALRECGFWNPQWKGGLSFPEVFHGYSMRDEQRALVESVTGPGVYVMEASMGSGKTEAALYAAYRLMAAGQARGLYFALPTRLTSNKIHERVGAFLGKVVDGDGAVKLAHGQAWLAAFGHGGEEFVTAKANLDRPSPVPSWFNPLKRSLLYPFAVGTIDQALLAAMNVKHSFVRLFGLAGKVVILDEVHSYDLYTGTLLDNLVTALRELGCTVIILSATLTRARREILLGHTSETGAYPLVCGAPVGGGRLTRPAQASRPSQRIELAWLAEGGNEPVEDALRHARQGCQVVCIANTVRTAQLWFRLLLSGKTQDDDSIRIGLLHSRFPGFRRSAIEEEWMSALGKDRARPPRGSILVSTQIVEQSVDIDADYMVSELAPVDMLLQRMGRLWRHDRANRPCKNPVFAIALARLPQDGDDADAIRDCFGNGSWAVYAPFVLLRSYETLSKRKGVTVPDDIRGLLEEVYADLPDSADGVQAALKADMDEKHETMRQRGLAAEVGRTSLPTRDDSEDAAVTRYGSQPMAQLLLVRDAEVDGRSGLRLTLCDGRTVFLDPYRRDITTTATLYDNRVAVQFYKLAEPLKDAVPGHETLARHFFKTDMPYVCLIDESGRLRLLKEDVELPLFYTPKFGVYDGADAEQLKIETPSPDEDGDFSFVDERKDW